MNVLRTAAYGVLGWIAVLAARHVFPKGEVEGVTVVLADADHDGPIDEHPGGAKLRAALTEFAAADPVRFGRLQRDVAFVVARPDASIRGVFSPPVRMIELDLLWVADAGTPVAAVAMLLAHEAMHARLRRRGVGFRPEQRVRIERLCVSAEVVLGRRLGEDRLVQAARAKRADAGRIWGTAAMEAYRGRRRAAMLEKLRALGLSRPAVRFFEWLVAEPELPTRQDSRLRAPRPPG